jgi:hypothetical protein
MPALVLIGYWALFTGLIFLALQYLPRKPFKLCCCIHHPVAAAQKRSALCAPTSNVHPPQPFTHLERAPTSTVHPPQPCM